MDKHSIFRKNNFQPFFYNVPEFAFKEFMQVVVFFSPVIAVSMLSMPSPHKEPCRKNKAECLDKKYKIIDPVI